MVANIVPIHAFRNVCISISVNFTGGDVTGRCQCFQECDMTTYDLQISTAAFPSNFLLHEIKEQLNFSEKQIRLITLFFIGDKLKHPVSKPDYHIICKQKYFHGFQYKTKCILHNFIKSNLFFFQQGFYNIDRDLGWRLPLYLFFCISQLFRIMLIENYVYRHHIWWRHNMVALST